MKTPARLAEKLTRQWANPGLREQRLLSATAWPIELPIGKPDAGQFADAPAALRDHIQQWRDVNVGDVLWGEQKYRDAAEPVALPLRWRLHKPSEWVKACNDVEVSRDHALLSRLITEVDPLFHALLVRQLPRLRKLPEAAVVLAAHIAQTLEPGIASGRPLRALSMGADSKFFERHRQLITRMLDLRFADQVSEQGLERFLGAVSERDHWLLLLPLQPGLLPFRQLRVRASELENTPLPAGNILVVENEQCLHQLPPLSDCIAILGAGLNLGWMKASWLSDRKLAYWGDLDSWGLSMLATARRLQPHLRALMMNRQVFEQFAERSVAEPVPCETDQTAGLTESELNLLSYLLARESGRLEQEFLPAEFVAEKLKEWLPN